jgi:type I restriction enzyme S subunit
LDRWTDLSSSGDSAALSPGWKIIRLNEVVRCLDVGEKVNPERSYPLAGVRLDGAGIYHRETVKGTETSAVFLSALQPGALIYGRLFAWRGAFAVVREEHSNLWCSSEFPQFACDASRLNVNYLCLWALSRETLRAVEKRSVGTSAVSRNRLKEREFLDLTIALPPLEEQIAIVERWQKAQANIAAMRARADAIEAQARTAFLAGLGLSEPSAILTRKAFALGFARVSRWGVAQMREYLAGPDPGAGKFPAVRLGEVIVDLENGWSPKCFPRPATSLEWGVLKLGAVSFGAFDEAENKALPPDLKPIPALEVRAGDTLISRANVPRYVGACAYVEQTRPKLMLCDKIFRVVPRPENPLNLRFLAEVMKTPHLRRQIENSTTGASPTMQNISKPSLLALRLPFPPLATQEKLVAEICTARAEAMQERATADELAALAAANLESELLGLPFPTSSSYASRT